MNKKSKSKIGQDANLGIDVSMDLPMKDYIRALFSKFADNFQRKSDELLASYKKIYKKLEELGF